MPKSFLEFLKENASALYGSLGISRIDMPQVAEVDIPDFVEYLKANGVNVDYTTLPIAQLKPTQSEVNTDKIEQKMMKDITDHKPFVVSLDGYIMDGHHQWAAILQRYPNAEVSAFTVNIPMTHLLRLAHKYPKVFYKSIEQ